MKELFSGYPEKLKASKQRAAQRYRLKKGVYAVHGKVPPPCKPGVMAIMEEGKLAVCKGNPGELPSSVDRNAITAVYAESGGPLAVPTGRILIRFEDGVTAVSQKEALQRIGYIIDQELAYAPQALWVKSVTGDIADALSNVPLLEALPRVVNVEPQMVMESGRRGPGP